jgi:Nuclease-related domain
VWLVLTWGLIGAAPAAGLLLSVTVGAWLGWPAALAVAVLAWARVRFRPSPGARIWRRQAAMQRRIAGMLAPLEDEGYVVLHDVTLPGWLDSLEHLVVGPTGVWVIGSWRRRRLPPGGAAPPQTVRGLRGQAFAVAETLAGWASVPVQPLLCVHGPWPVRPRPTDGVRVAGPAQLLDVVRDRPRSRPTDLGQATDRLLDVLRPAA